MAPWWTDKFYHLSSGLRPSMQAKQAGSFFRSMSDSILSISKQREWASCRLSFFGGGGGGGERRAWPTGKNAGSEPPGCNFLRK